MLTTSGSAIDEVAFRRALSCFASGVVVVTGLADGRPVGLTCQSFVSVSLDPPLVAVAVGHSSTSWKALAPTRAFAVNILNDRQQSLCMAFARSGSDKFHGRSWQPGALGLPLLDGVLAHIECTIETVTPAGDHDLVVGRVHSLADHDLECGPLLFYRSRFLEPR